MELPERELRDWAIYWSEEPWGPYRDNLHAGLIISELMRPHLKKGATPPRPDQYLFQSATDLKRKQTAQFVAQMNSAARRDRETRGRKK
jgi:hypothetical protein